MSDPEYFDVAYSINPWMKGEKVNNEKAIQQWQFLKNQLEKLGANITTIMGHANWPDLVFCANAGIIHDNSVVLSNFKHTQRRGEKEIFKAWFKQNDYTVLELPEDIIFEGRGDCFVFKNKYLIGGYGKRSDRISIEKAADLLELIPVPVKLQDDRFYHLDTCLSIIDNNLAIYYPPAFELNIVDLFTPIGLTDLIPVSTADALAFACNSITLNHTLLLPEMDHNPTFEKKLNSLGYQLQSIPMSEFLKSGGATRCLILEL